MNKKTYYDILDSAASDSLSHKANLWPNISAQLERKSLMQTMHTRPLVIVVLALLAFFLVSGVAYALSRSLGYIPGIGIVDQTVPVRILAEPVTVQQQGISVTVSKVVADSMRTFISYRVDGIPLVENEIPACINVPEIRLPDGVFLEDKTGSGGTVILKNGNTMYYEDQSVYSPIPSGTNNLTFVLSCVLPERTEPEHWEITLKLSPAPSNFATPVIEIGATYSVSSLTLETTPISTPTTTFQTPFETMPTPEGIKPSLPAASIPVSQGSALSFENILELADSYILIGKFTDPGDLAGPLYISTDSDFEYLPRIEDANGNPVSFKLRQDIRPDPIWDVAYYWAYEIPKPVTAPLKITVDRVNTRKYNTTQIQFNPGGQPQVGQQWNLNQSVALGSSEFVVDSVAFLGNGYIFNLSSENLPEGVTPDIEILDGSLNPYQFDNIDGTEEHAGNKSIHTIRLTTQNTPPTGNLIVKWGLDEFIPQPGPWSLVWAPPVTNP